MADKLTLGQAKQNILDTFGFGVDAPTPEDYNIYIGD